MNSKASSPQGAEWASALKGLRQYFLHAAAFSAAVNLLMLVPAFYMLQLFDRVILSGSLDTLLMLTLLLLFLLGAMGGFEWVRSQILVAASNRLERSLRWRVLDAAFRQALRDGGLRSNAQPLADLSGLRQFLTGNGLFAFFDAPWFPVYALLLFLFHPWFGALAVGAGLVLVGLAYVNEKVTSARLKQASSESGAVNNTIADCLRNAEVVDAMGMLGNIGGHLSARADQVLGLQSNASQWSGTFTAISKTFRLLVQSLTLGLGAWLSIRQDISPGLMIASSILLGRALAPIDQLVGSWKAFSIARAQYERLGALLRLTPPQKAKMSLPAPAGRISVENAVAVPPGGKAPVLKGLSFALESGESLGVIGPSGSGKSCLARILLGIWPTAAGSVRLDHAVVADWTREELGPHLGYLPQDIELFEGSVAQNICRFGGVDPEQVVAAARMAGVHELILGLEEGYDTVIGAHGGILSGGQRQRIALARALYGNPRLVVLDEPNSNLDDQGEKALAESLKRLKAAGSTVVVISHRAQLLLQVDKILLLNDGRMAGFGPRAQMLAKLLQPAETAKTEVPGRSASR